MKKAIFTIVLMIACVTNLSAQSVDDLFDEFKDKQGVEYVQIPKALMAMAKGFVKKDEGGDFAKKNFAKKIDSIRILNIEGSEDLRNKFAMKATNLKKNGYETMVNSNEENEKTLILVKTKNETITEMVILNIEPNECALIQMKGKFNSSDVNNMNF